MATTKQIGIGIGTGALVAAAAIFLAVSNPSKPACVVDPINDLSEQEYIDLKAEYVTKLEKKEPLLAMPAVAADVVGKKIDISTEPITGKTQDVQTLTKILDNELKCRGNFRNIESMDDLQTAVISLLTQ